MSQDKVLEREQLRQRIVQEVEACLTHFYTSKDVPNVDDHSSIIRASLGPVILMAYGAELRKQPVVPATVKARRWMFIHAMSKVAAANWAEARGIGRRWTWISDGSVSQLIGQRDYCFVNLASSVQMPLTVVKIVEADIQNDRCKIIRPDDEIPFVP